VTSPDAYPRTDEQGRTVWACCESSIGPDCAHKVPGPFRVGEPMRVTDAQAKRYQRSREEMPF
jgi:hypothetical protein